MIDDDNPEAGLEVELEVLTKLLTEVAEVGVVTVDEEVVESVFVVVLVSVVLLDVVLGLLVVDVELVSKV